MHITTTTKITQELIDECGDNLFPKSSKLRIYSTAAFAMVVGVLLLAFAFPPEGINYVFLVLAGVLIIFALSILYNMRSLIAKYVERAKIGIKEQFEERCDYIEEEIVFEDNLLKARRTGSNPSPPMTIEYGDIVRFEEVGVLDGQPVFIIQSISGHSAFVCAANLTAEEDVQLMQTLKQAQVKVRRKTKREQVSLPQDIEKAAETN